MSTSNTTVSHFFCYCTEPEAIWSQWRRQWLEVLANSKQTNSTNKSIQTANTQIQQTNQFKQTNSKNKPIQTANLNNKPIETANSTNKPIQTANSTNKPIQTTNSTNKPIQTAYLKKQTNSNKKFNKQLQ